MQAFQQNGAIGPSFTYTKHSRHGTLHGTEEKNQQRYLQKRSAWTPARTCVKIGTENRDRTKEPQTAGFHVLEARRITDVLHMTAA